MDSPRSSGRPGMSYTTNPARRPAASKVTASKVTPPAVPAADAGGRLSPSPPPVAGAGRNLP